MCGIAGFQAKGIGDKECIIRPMLGVIAHRGPDACGVRFVDDVCLGHVRLAIIDVEHGKQPVESADGRYSLIFNGEIYNYVELRQELINKGYKLKTYADSEVLLYMYIEYGERIFEHLNGMFAFAVYDLVEKTLFLARDHFGIKPLYYFQDKDCFVFASEIKALLKYPAVKARVNKKSLYEYIKFQMVLNEATLFENIFKLKPAHYIVIKNNKIVKNREYWKLEYNIDDTKTIEGYTDELLLLLDNSLALQMRSDVPVGAYLSGGLDSSIVSTLASKNYSGRFKTFTGAFKDLGEYNETRYARIAGDFINSEHYEILITYKDFLDNFEKLVYHMDEPAAGPGLFSQYMVAKFASQYVKVILGGQGADEVFGGYARYAIAYLEQCLKGAILKTQEEGRHIVTLQSIISNLPMLKQYIPMIQNHFASGLFDNMDRRYFKLVDRSPNTDKIYSDEFLRQRNEDEIFDKFCQIFNKQGTKSYFNKMTYFDIKTLLPSLLQVEDRVGMAVSIESRVPLLDRRIVELAVKMPPTMKFAGGRIKNALAEAVKNILPKEIVSRKDKMGFPTPLNEWFTGPLKGFVLDIFRSKSARERGIFNIEYIEQQVDKSDKFGRDLWGALNIEMWFRKFID